MTVYEFFRDFQTLIVGVPALIAAICAAVGVGGQLAEMRVQSAAVRRDLIASRLSEIANRRSTTVKAITNIAREIGWELSLHDEAVPDVDSHWAFNHAGLISQEMAKLQSRESDPELLTSAIVAVTDSLKSLHDCLDALHRPQSMQGDPDLTEQQEKQIEEEEKAMRPELIPRYHQLSATLDALDIAFADHVGGVRKTLAKIDNELMK